MNYINVNHLVQLYDVMSTGPARRYFPEPATSILVVKPAIVERAKARFDHLGFTVVTGTRYLGGFIGTTADESSRIQQRSVIGPPESPASPPSHAPPPIRLHRFQAVVPAQVPVPTARSIRLC